MVRVWMRVGERCGFPLLCSSLKAFVFFLLLLCKGCNLSSFSLPSSGVPSAVQRQRPIRQGLLCVLQRLERPRVRCPCHAVHRPTLQRARHLHWWELCVLNWLQRPELCRGWEPLIRGRGGGCYPGLFMCQRERFCLTADTCTLTSNRC